MGGDHTKDRQEPLENQLAQIDLKGDNIGSSLVSYRMSREVLLDRQNKLNELLDQVEEVVPLYLPYLDTAHELHATEKIDYQETVSEGIQGRMRWRVHPDVMRYRPLNSIRASRNARSYVIKLQVSVNNDPKGSLNIHALKHTPDAAARISYSYQDNVIQGLFHPFGKGEPEVVLSRRSLIKHYTEALESSLQQPKKDQMWLARWLGYRNGNTKFDHLHRNLPHILSRINYLFMGAQDQLQIEIDATHQRYEQKNEEEFPQVDSSTLVNEFKKLEKK